MVKFFGKIGLLQSAVRVNQSLLTSYFFDALTFDKLCLIYIALGNFCFEFH